MVQNNTNNLAGRRYSWLLTGFYCCGYTNCVFIGKYAKRYADLRKPRIGSVRHKRRNSAFRIYGKTELWACKPGKTLGSSDLALRRCDRSVFAVAGCPGPGPRHTRLIGVDCLLGSAPHDGNNTLELCGRLHQAEVLLQRDVRKSPALSHRHDRLTSATIKYDQCS